MAASDLFLLVLIDPAISDSCDLCGLEPKREVSLVLVEDEDEEDEGATVEEVSDFTESASSLSFSTAS